jgi:flagellar hook assembly protein FlgD
MKADLETNAVEENTIESLSYINLSQNYPNPFNPQTKINFNLKKGGKTTLKIFNVKGQLVKQLIDEYKQPGQYSVIWDGTNMQNKQVASGAYYYRLQVGNRVKTKSLMLVK